MNKAEDVLNILENVVSKSFDPQEPCDVEDVLDSVLSRVELAKAMLKRIIASDKVIEINGKFSIYEYDETGTISGDHYVELFACPICGAVKANIDDLHRKG